MTAAIRFGSRGGDDPFAKVKGLIENMIAKLEKEAEEEATEKAYCDEEMAKTEAKRGELMDDVAKLSAKIDQASSKSVALTEDIKQLEAELAALLKSQSEMDKIRQEESADFQQAKEDLTLGLTGVRKALTVLRDY
jgi:chromosome segregation ATPase